MNNKGQANIGVIIGIFMVALVGAILLVASAQQVGETINTKTTANATYAGTNATNTSIQGKFWSDLVVYNATNNEIIGSGNYTLYNNVVINGEETARLEQHTNHLRFDGDWLISGTVQETTYIGNSGARSVAGIIIIFFALAIAVAALSPIGQNMKILQR